MFVFEFHLPYCALREGQPITDTRRLRRHHTMLNPVEQSRDELFCYDAQISFLITGVDEWLWTAYCCVDMFFGSEQDPETYYIREVDGPSGGERSEDYPTWNPREYFMLVLSQRVTQITREWENVLYELCSRLEVYVIHAASTVEVIILLTIKGACIY